MSTLNYSFMTLDIDNTSIKNPFLKGNLKIDNEHSMVEFGDGIAIINHHQNLTNIIDVQMVLENISALNKLSENKICPLLVDFSEFKTINPLYTPTARTVFLGSEFTQRRSAIAFLFNGNEQVSKSFQYKTANKFNIPLKLFSNREEAFDWLKTFILN